MKVSRVEEMRHLDRAAVDRFGIDEEILMENAGYASYEVIRQECGIKGLSFLILCGIGNNGGDGLVVARKIHSMGGQVKILYLGDTARFKGPAKKNFDMISRLPIQAVPMPDRNRIRTDIARADVLVDAIFGTGLTRKVEGLHKDAIDLMNESGKPVFSLDIPSGINGNTGRIMGTCVRADATITFGLPKIGNMLYPGFMMGGKLYVSHISFPVEMTDSAAMKIAVNEPHRLPERQKAGHKGSFGDTLFIAGAAAYQGAPYFSALSFLKAGGGYSRLASPSGLSLFESARGSEIVYVPMENTDEGSIAKSNFKKLLQLAQNVDMVVIGPGLSLNPETQEMVVALVNDIEKPVLIDGDGITAVSLDPNCLIKRKPPTILTPHPGEMSRLTGVTISDIEADRIEILQETCERLKSTIVLKGAHSLIGFSDRRVFINTSGNSGMATAGSGDVLTGTIAAMSGLGLPLEEAVKTGVFMHGFAGDLIAAEKGEDGITAQDILEALPDAVRFFRNSYDDIVANSYESLFTI